MNATPENNASQNLQRGRVSFRGQFYLLLDLQTKYFCKLIYSVATSSKCIPTRNKGITASSKKLLVPSGY